MDSDALSMSILMSIRRLQSNRMKTLPLLVFVLLIYGCGNKVWVKEGATQKDFDRDKALCIEKSHTGPKTSKAAPSEKTADPKKFSTCMSELGYGLEYDRPLDPRLFWRRD